MQETQQKIVFYDTETNGLGNSARVLQFASITLMRTVKSDGTTNNVIHRIDDFLINDPDVKYIDAKATQVHGIRISDLREKGIDKKEADKRIFKILNQAIVYAYNAPFDARIVAQTIQEPIPLPKYRANCLMQMSKSALGLTKAIKLVDASERLGVTERYLTRRLNDDRISEMLSKKAHNAVYDTLIAMGIYMKISADEISNILQQEYLETQQEKAGTIETPQDLFI